MNNSDVNIDHLDIIETESTAMVIGVVNQQSERNLFVWPPSNAAHSKFELSQKDIDKLYKRHELSSLYVDANLIHFLFSVIKLYDYNPGEYYSLLQGTNNILKIKSDIDTFYESNGEYPENTSELLQSALELKQKTISCKDVTFKIFGLSLATFNIFISLIISVIVIKLFLNYEKNK